MTSKALRVIQTTKKLMSFRDQLLQLKIRAFAPKIQFQIDIGDYTVKTATTTQELEQILKLRYEVFIREGLNKRKLMGVDFDRYDLVADHVLVMEKSTNTTIGTYRLLCSKFTNDFYSQNEFVLDKFLETPGIKLELGRACIHKDYRNGTTLNLIWKGIGAYAVRCNADYMFGCASVKTIDPALSLALYQHMHDHHGSEYGVHPTPDYQFKKIAATPTLYDVTFLEEQIPSLLKSYIKAGAKIHGFPAVDYDFDCIDFLTILNLNKINDRFRARYLENAQP